MECNKDEATRAKEIAERKFAGKDTLGAKKFALKALNLFPALEGISQMVATFDVYISAENKTNGEADWYGVLGVDPFADDNTVRRQYRKLALLLHPDKNKTIGADGAFKLISAAWSLLSDKAKRAAYDKRSMKEQKASAKFGSSTKKGTNGSYNLNKHAPSTATTRKNTAKEHTSSSTHKSKSNTFWTVCHGCKMQYEYLRVYLNLKLLCPNCHEAFVAVETAPPPASGIRPATQWSFSLKQSANGQMPNKTKSNAGKNSMTPPNVGAGSCSKTDSYKKANFQWAPFSKTSGVSNVAQAASVVQQAYDKVKRDREEAQAASKREEALKRKQHVKKGYYNPAKRRRGGMEDKSAGNHGKEIANRMSKQGNCEHYRVNGVNTIGNVGDISPVELKNLLIEKARKEISNKLKEIQSNAVDKTVLKESGNDFQKVKEEGEECLRNSEMCAQGNIEKSEDRKSGSQAIKSFAGSTIAKVSRKFLETTPVDVPDPDFHSFYKDRTERSFDKNQVWAVYDNNDGMPRYYAMIHRIISLNPIKMLISWLNPNTNTELGPLNWVASGFSKICGDFRMSRNEICTSTNFFSHKVRWRMGAGGAICIYPRKGDVWAIYRNWSPNWNELTADEVIQKFDVVEVLEDFIEGHGIDVIPLVKVAGFRTLFHNHLDPREIRIIPKEEMFRFSHQIPSYVLTGQEAADAPKDCRVLDPAATPFELLQVIEVVKLEDVVANEDCYAGKISENMKENTIEEMINDIGKLREEKEGKVKDMQDAEPSNNMKKASNEEVINDMGILGEEKQGKDEDMQEVETLKEDKVKKDM